MNIIDKYLLKKLASKICLDRVSRSGKEGKLVDCYSIYININEKEKLLFKDIKEDKLYCLIWNNEKDRFIEETLIPINQLVKDEFFITHLYGLTTIEFDSFRDFSFNYFTKWEYIKINIINFITTINQYIFNRGKMYTKKKIDLLKFLVEFQIKNDSGNGLSFISLMTELHTIKWLFHPEKDEEKRRLKLYLDSMIKNGEIELKNDKYLVTGKALDSLEKNEESEQRHNSNIRLQFGIYILTGFIALGTIIQAFK